MRRLPTTEDDQTVKDYISELTALLRADINPNDYFITVDNYDHLEKTYAPIEFVLHPKNNMNAASYRVLVKNDYTQNQEIHPVIKREDHAKHWIIFARQEKALHEALATRQHNTAQRSTIESTFVKTLFTADGHTPVLLYKNHGESIVTRFKNSATLPLQLPLQCASLLQQYHDQLLSQHNKTIVRPSSKHTKQKKLPSPASFLELHSLISAGIGLKSIHLNAKNIPHLSSFSHYFTNPDYRMPHFYPWYQFPEDVYPGNDYNDYEVIQSHIEKKFSFMIGCLLSELITQNTLFKDAWMEQHNNTPRAELFEKDLFYSLFHQNIISRLSSYKSHPRWGSIVPLLIRLLQQNPEKRPKLTEAMQTLRALTHQLNQDASKQSAIRQQYSATNKQLTQGAMSYVCVEKHNKKTAKGKGYCVNKKANSASSSSEVLLKEIAIIEKIKRHRSPWKHYLMIGAHSFTHLPVVSVSMPYARGGDLFDQVTQYKPIQTRHFIELLKGLHTLHQLKILHLDLKLDNIFITEKGSVQIADFGLSCQMKHRLMGERVTSELFRGSPGHIPPEMIHNGYLMSQSSSLPEYQAIGAAADIWSLGQVFFSMITRQTLWSCCAKKLYKNAEQVTQPNDIKTIHAIYNDLEPSFQQSSITTTLPEQGLLKFIKKNVKKNRNYSSDHHTAFSVKLSQAIQGMLLWNQKERPRTAQLIKALRKDYDVTKSSRINPTQ